MDLRLSVNFINMFLKIPTVGIIYKINTDGLDIDILWIASRIMGHYNNGFRSDEWIAKYIPPINYSVMEAIIGPDFLYDVESVDVTDMVVAENKIQAFL